MKSIFTITQKYLTLLVAFFKTSFMSDVEFRFNIATRIFTDIIWYAAQLSVFEVLFGHTSSLSGWTLPETRVFMGVLFITDSIYMIFMQANLDGMGEKIRRGDLDLLLVKPVNSQWMISFQRMAVAYIGNFLISLGYLIWALAQIEGLSMWNILWLLITIPIGTIIIYSIRFLVSTTALYFTRADAINYIWYQVYRLGTRPESIYPTVLRYAVLTILPIAFLASIPAQVILGKQGPEFLLLGIFVAGALLWASTVFWRRGLRAYSSASS